MQRQNSVGAARNLELLTKGGADPWSAADALVGSWLQPEEPDQGSGADEGVRPT